MRRKANRCDELAPLFSCRCVYSLCALVELAFLFRLQKIFLPLLHLRFSPLVVTKNTLVHGLKRDQIKLMFPLKNPAACTLRSWSC